MEGIILAGGFGTRLRDLVHDLPKPMAPIGERPFLEVLLGMLARKGFCRIIISLGFLGEIILSHFGNQCFGMDLIYVAEERPLGTGGAVRLAMTKCVEDHVFVFNGDTYLDVDAPSVEKLWRKKQGIIVVGCDVQDSARYGRLIVYDSRVKGFLEKGDGGPGPINAGCYVFPVGCLDSWPLGVAFSLEKEFLSDAVSNGSVEYFRTAGLFIDIGVPSDYIRAQELLRDVV